MLILLKFYKKKKKKKKLFFLGKNVSIRIEDTVTPLTM